MSAGALAKVGQVLERGGEPDDVLRAAVAALADEPGVVWAGIAFLEEGALVLGPTAGEPDKRVRTRTPISYQDDPVGELQTDGDVDAADLEAVATLVAPYVLIGWDTRGEAWEP